MFSVNVKIFPHAPGTALKALLPVALCCCAAVAEACTSFAIHPSVSETGRMLLQKCRDSRMGRLDADIMTAKNGRRWMRIGSDGGAMFAMSDRGVAVTVNTGNTLAGDDIPRKAPRQPSVFRVIMERCSTAEEGIKLLKGYFRNPTGIYMIADAKRAFLVEAGAGYGEHLEIPGGILVVANEMHLPGVEEYNTSMAIGMFKQRAREANTRAELRKSRNRDGKYTRRGMFAVSRKRYGKTFRDYNVFRPISPKSGVGSISAVCFELDGEFPAQLSTAYIALGAQRHTVYLPCPMALEQFPEKVRSGTWADLATKIREKQGEANPLLGRIVALEDELLTEYDRVREEARGLLRAGKTAEAVKLLNDSFATQFDRADALMTKLAACAPARSAKKSKTPEKTGGTINKRK